MYFNKKWNELDVVNSNIINDVKIIQPSTYYEYRGEIGTTYHSDYYDELITDGSTFKHDRYSRSHKNVLRGIHFDNKTWKLIQCLHGEIYLVVLDLRFDSTTYGKWESFILSPKTNIQVLIPPMVGNGHYVMKDDSLFNYKLAYKGEFNDVDKQGTVKWNADEFNVQWPVNNPILSTRDGA